MAGPGEYQGDGDRLPGAELAAQAGEQYPSGLGGPVLRLDPAATEMVICSLPEGQGCGH
jgi:hypothetical protein